MAARTRPGRGAFSTCARAACCAGGDAQYDRQQSKQRGFCYSQLSCIGSESADEHDREETRRSQPHEKERATPFSLDLLYKHHRRRVPPNPQNLDLPSRHARLPKRFPPQRRRDIAVQGPQQQGEQETARDPGGGGIGYGSGGGGGGEAEVHRSAGGS